MHLEHSARACHLSARCVTTTLYRSTLRRSSPCDCSTSPDKPGVMPNPTWVLTRAGNPPSPVYTNFQLPTCTARMSPCARWALTPPSHPYPLPEEKRRSFSSALVQPHGQLPVKKRNALRCPDFPPAPHIERTRQAVRLHFSLYIFSLWMQNYEIVVIPLKFCNFL